MDDYCFLKAITPLKHRWIQQHLGEKKEKTVYHSSQKNNHNLERKKQESWKILDLGCGPGLLTLPLWSLSYKLYGVDEQKEVLNALHLKSLSYFSCDFCSSPAKEKEEIKNSFLPSTFFQSSCGCLQGFLKSFCELSFPQEFFDVVLLMDTLEHCSHPPNLLESIFSWLKPGGYLLGSTLNRHFLSKLGAITWSEYMTNLIPQGTHEYKNFIQPQELNLWLEKAGFSSLEYQGFGPKTPFSLLPSLLLQPQQWDYKNSLFINYFFKALKNF